MASQEEPHAIVLTGGKKRFECTECNEVFFSDNPDALFKHKEKKIALGQGHLTCGICDEKLHSSEAWYYHLRMNHPADQCLHCPACGELHIKVHKLMIHLTVCEKAANALALIDGSRQQSLEFIRQLNYRDHARVRHGVQLGPAPINNDFGEYLGLKDPTVESTEYQKLALTMQDLELEYAASVDEYRQGDSKGFDFITSDGHALHEENNSLNVYSQASVTKNTTATNKAFPNALLAVKSASQQLAVSNKISRSPALNLEVRDPYSKGFDVCRFYEPVMQRYRCAHAPHCLKTFKKAGQLIGHLKSNDHLPPKYRCPFCSKMYRTLSALTQHCESPNTFCEVDYSHSYRIFLGQLTGGIIDVDGTHADHSPKYVVTDTGRKMFCQEHCKSVEQHGKNAGNLPQMIHCKISNTDAPKAGLTPEILEARKIFQEMTLPEKKDAVYDEFVDNYYEEKKKEQQQKLALNVTW